MYRVPWSRTPVVCDLMSVIVAAMHPDGIIVCADRATTHPGPGPFPGVPNIGPAPGKLLLSPTGCVAALAGIGATHDGEVNLLELMQQVISVCSSGVQAAVAVKDLFESQSAKVLHDQDDPVWRDTIMHTHVITAALVAGPGRDGPELDHVSLPRDGVVGLQSLKAPGLAMGPDLAQIDLDRAAQDSSHEATLDTAATVLTDAIGRASVQSPAMVSSDCDLVILTRDGTSHIHEQRFSDKASVPPGA